MKSAPAIAFDYRPSRWLAGAVLALGLLALLSVRLSALAPGLQVLLGAGVCAYTAICVRVFLGSPLRRLAWHQAGHWRLADASGTEHVAELEHAVTRAGWILLRLRRNDGIKLRVVLAPDNCDPDVRRRLRVRLARGRDQAAA